MRLIDADDLIVMGLDAPDDEHQLKFVPYEFIEEAETIDAVPVVRCRDCYSQKLCRYAQYLGENGFCSNGERGTDETN